MSAPSSPEATRELVRERYGAIASEKTSCCGPSASSAIAPSDFAEVIGYTADSLINIPEGANLGLGCGSPTALAGLSAGEVVVDLGAGAGLDALIAAKLVGPEGRVIGVDMTPEMLKSARKHAVEMDVHGYVEFREGLIEALPIASGTADVLISNCVINLSPDKPEAFREAFRVLKSGGRLAISDIVLSAPLPDDIRNQAAAYVACVAGALTEDVYLGAMRAAGFTDITWTRTPAAQLLISSAEVLEQAGAPAIDAERLHDLNDTVWSYKITARKP